MHNFFIEHNYSQYVIYNFKSEFKIWKIIIVMILIPRIFIK